MPVAPGSFPLYPDLKRPWDASAAVKRWRRYCTGSDGEVDWAKFRRGFMWYDAEKADQMGGYKLPFVDVIGGKPYAIWRAILAIKSRIGSTQIPEADKQKVMARVRAYERKAGKKMDELIAPLVVVDSTLTPVRHVLSSVEEIADSYDGRGILVRIEATHAGYVNKNWRYYTAEGMRRSVRTWLEPYPAPYLVNHDLSVDPRGRVRDARFVSTGKDRGYIELDVYITHPEEIQMILDKRALTVSASAEPAAEVECVACGQDLRKSTAPRVIRLPKRPPQKLLEQEVDVLGIDLTVEELWEVEKDEDGYVATCRHLRGALTPIPGLERLYWRLHGFKYREISRVNEPADVNEETGEFAHIREVVEDSAELRVLSQRDDLYQPGSVSEALMVYDSVGEEAIWSRRLWHELEGEQDVRRRMERYLQSGGLLVAPSVDRLLEAPPSEFYDWLRTSGLGEQEFRLLDRIYSWRRLRGA